MSHVPRRGNRPGPSVRRRSTNRIRLLPVVVLALLVGLVAPARPAAAGSVEDEKAFLAMINQLRAEEGLNPLVVHPELTEQARAWAEQMAKADQLSHAPDMTIGITAPWTVLGENVGVHGVHNLDQLFSAFVASPSHYKNLIDSRFQYVGVGVVHGPDGSLWTTHRFMATSETVAPTTSPATSPPIKSSPTTAAPIPVPKTPPTGPASSPTTQPSKAPTSDSDPASGSGSGADADKTGETGRSSSTTAPAGSGSDADSSSSSSTDSAPGSVDAGAADTGEGFVGENGGLATGDLSDRLPPDEGFDDLIDEIELDVELIERVLDDLAEVPF